MDSLDDLLEEAQHELEVPANELLAEVSDLSHRQVELEKEVAEITATLKEKERELRKVTEIDLPTAMDQLNLAKLTLTDGSVVDVTTHYGGSILVDDREEACDWLEAHDLSALITNNIVVKFKAKEQGREKAKEFAKQMLEEQREIDSVLNVHAQTLKKFVRERTEAGEEIPELFNPQIVRKARVK